MPRGPPKSPQAYMHATCAAQQTDTCLPCPGVTVCNAPRAASAHATCLPSPHLPPSAFALTGAFNYARQIQKLDLGLVVVDNSRNALQRGSQAEARTGVCKPEKGMGSVVWKLGSSVMSARAAHVVSMPETVVFVCAHALGCLRLLNRLRLRLLASDVCSC